MSRALLVRIAFAVPAIALSLLVVRLGGWPLAAVLAGLGVLGAREIYQLARRTGVEPLDGAGYAGAAALPLLVFAAHGGGRAGALAYAGVLWLLGVLAVAMRRGPAARPLPAVGVTVFGALYAAAPLACLIAIRHGANSAREPTAYFVLALAPLVLTWICDTAAYGAGTALGGARLAAVLSPKKTWSGAAGGLLAALLFAPLLGTLVLNRAGWHFDAGQLLGLGLVVGTVGQLGDLAESLLKREAGVKDSSALVPGHGGVLDRLDSLYFVIPAAAALFHWYGVI